MDRSTLAIHAGRGPRAPGAPLNPPLVLASSFHGGAYAREEGAPTWEAFEEALGCARGRPRGGVRERYGGGRGDPRDAAVRARVWSARWRGYAWTRSLLAERAAAGRIALRDRRHHRHGRRRCARARARTCCGSSRRATRCSRSPSSTGCAAAPCRVAVDSTFATPLLQRPLELGAAFSLHSATKFIGGHSDLLLGVVSVRDDRRRALRHARAQVGATPGTLEAFLALRGLRTLPVRLERAQRTAQTLAERLSAHPAVGAVHYPGFGAMLSFEVRGDPLAVCERGAASSRYAKSLGGVESLIDRRGPSLLRLSVGCEHVEDLWGDLDARAGTRRRPRAARRRPRPRTRCPSAPGGSAAAGCRCPRAACLSSVEPLVGELLVAVLP